MTACPLSLSLLIITFLAHDFFIGLEMSPLSKLQNAKVNGHFGPALRDLYWNWKII
jgi:hypothetical protein